MSVCQKLDFLDVQTRIFKKFCPPKCENLDKVNHFWNKNPKIRKNECPPETQKIIFGTLSGGHSFSLNFGFLVQKWVTLSKFSHFGGQNFLNILVRTSKKVQFLAHC